MTNSLYEQLKDDLGYLGLARIGRVLRRCWPKRPRPQEWSHIEFLARVIGEQATSTLNRKLAARLRFARFPFRRNLERLRLRVPAQRRPQADRGPGHAALHRREPATLIHPGLLGGSIPWKRGWSHGNRQAVKEPLDAALQPG